jgi:quercetin dioxygenase-like cupin family protein
MTMLAKGRLLFYMEGGVHTVNAGQVMVIPPNVPHRVEAIEDSEATDLFSPVREDWRRGDDAYLRGGGSK